MNPVSVPPQPKRRSEALPHLRAQGPSAPPVRELTLRWATGHGVTQSWTWARLSAGAQADRKPEFHLNLEFVLLRTALPQAFCSKSISAQLKKEVWKGN